VIKVKRHKDGKCFTNDISKNECIYEIHFCTSYTEVMVQEVDSEGNLRDKQIICQAVGGTESDWIELIATQDDDIGEFVTRII